MLSSSVSGAAPVTRAARAKPRLRTAKNRCTWRRGHSRALPAPGTTAERVGAPEMPAVWRAWRQRTPPPPPPPPVVAAVAAADRWGVLEAATLYYGPRARGLPRRCKGRHDDACGRWSTSGQKWAPRWKSTTFETGPMEWSRRKRAARESKAGGGGGGAPGRQRGCGRSRARRAVFGRRLEAQVQQDAAAAQRLRQRRGICELPTQSRHAERRRDRRAARSLRARAQALGRTCLVVRGGHGGALELPRVLQAALFEHGQQVDHHVSGLRVAACRRRVRGSRDRGACV